MSNLTPKRREQLLKGFNGPGRLMTRALVRRLGADEANAVDAKAKKLYEELIEDLPHRVTFMAGARDATYVYLAFYKVLAERGMTADEVGELYGEAWAGNPGRNIPSWLPRLLVRPLLPLIRRKIRKDAALSQERRDPNGFVFSYVEPDDGNDFAIDITDCAVCKGFKRHGAEEVIPYLCALDDKMSAQMGFGLRRTGTRALGAECCDFRYKLGGEPQAIRPRTLTVIE